MTEWIDQTFTVWLESLKRGRDARGELHVGINDDAVTVETWDGEECDRFVLLQPKTRKEANQLSMIFRKASRRFEEIGKGLV